MGVERERVSGKGNVVLIKEGKTSEMLVLIILVLLRGNREGLV